MSQDVNINAFLSKFLLQAKTQDSLRTAEYPKEYNGLRVRVSFGQGSAARIPWIAFLAEGMQVSRGFYPVYLFHKEKNILILSYGVSETNEIKDSWPSHVVGDTSRIGEVFEDAARYGDSYVYKVYKVEFKGESISIHDTSNARQLSDSDIENDLLALLECYKQALSNPNSNIKSQLAGGEFALESQLEDFLIENWEKNAFR